MGKSGSTPHSQRASDHRCRSASSLPAHLPRRVLQFQGRQSADTSRHQAWWYLGIRRTRRTHHPRSISPQRRIHVAAASGPGGCCDRSGKCGPQQIAGHSLPGRRDLYDAGPAVPPGRRRGVTNSADPTHRRGARRLARPHPRSVSCDECCRETSPEENHELPRGLSAAEPAHPTPAASNRGRSDD